MHIYLVKPTLAREDLAKSEDKVIRTVLTNLHTEAVKRIMVPVKVFAEACGGEVKSVGDNFIVVEVPENQKSGLEAINGVEDVTENNPDAREIALA